MKRLSLLFISIFAVLIFTGCNSSDEAVTIVEDNTSFEELKKQSNKTYNLKTTDGRTITLTVENDVLTSEQLKGKYVLLNFWATWCPPCIKEMPVFNKLYEKYQDKFELIGILFERDKDVQELAAFMEKHKIKFPITVGEENFRMAKAFDDVNKIPESFLYGTDGRFLKKYVGEVGEKDLESFLSK
ncbi:thioredoxin [Arcobacter sp. F155]|uniref:TlpA disulfide reductase family protein n=1 Tax=Arcobacteraceae TaxID=2808963 RepID=UPI00100AF8C6|nr:MULTISPECIES: TlpA disulfide reductase family protein [unclassified Arcobacter]RXJ78474.1 thioredoxin [Arcobacter sp. F155]RXK02030.1 thioredoxin [Arcobacter sp. CECT 8989]